jgi:hypothetical protein
MRSAMRRVPPAGLRKEARMEVMEAGEAMWW